MDRSRRLVVRASGCLLQREKTQLRLVSRRSGTKVGQPAETALVTAPTMLSPPPTRDGEVRWVSTKLQFLRRSSGPRGGGTALGVVDACWAVDIAPHVYTVGTSRVQL